MDIEQKQEELIDHFVKQALSLSGSALASVVAEATSHHSLFAFSEILAVPNVLQHLSNQRADLEINEKLCTHFSFLSKYLEMVFGAREKQEKIGPRLFTFPI